MQKNTSNVSNILLKHDIFSFYLYNISSFPVIIYVHNLYNNNEWPILVDVNGDKRPNRLGQDRFVMHFADSRNASSLYVSEANVIKPWEDIEKKGRWCPSGHCLYTTWLLQ